MVSCMLADDIDDRHLGSFGIVQIGKSVGEARAKMNESACRFLSHARIAVGGSSDNAFKETEHRAHFRQSVERSNNMHFRSAGIREAGPNSSSNQSTDQALCSVHRLWPYEVRTGEFAEITRKHSPKT